MKKWITTLALVIGLLAVALLVESTQVSAQHFAIFYCECIDVSDLDARRVFMEDCDANAIGMGFDYGLARPIPSHWATGKLHYLQCGICDESMRAPTYFICSGPITD